ncbi:MAG: hypothetical protein JSW33_13510 [bacterium]|nr:MAG: hypothetical protein JSW33_13510 [bacterium]
MKAYLFIIITIILMISSRAISQRVEIALMTGYQMGGILDETTQQEGIFTPGDALGLTASGNFGVMLDIRLAKKAFLELSIDRQPTNLNYHEAPDGEISRSMKINVDYYQAGIIYDWSSSYLRPFFGLAIGLVHLAPDENLDSETRLNFSPLMVGVKTYASKYFAFRLHARLLISDAPEKIYFKDTDGEGFYHEKSTFMTQIQFGVGMVLSL